MTVRYRKDERKEANRIRMKLREARLSRGLSMEAAARLAGYAGKSGWAMVELGYNIPSAEQMDRMAKALGHTADELFNEIAEAAGAGRR